MSSQALPRHAVTGIEIVGTAAAYYALAQLAFLQHLGPTGQLRLLFPSSGVAVAALVVWGWKVWPGIFVGSAAVGLSLARPPLAVVGIAASSTLGALLAWFLLRRVGFRPSLKRVRDLAALVAVAAIAAMAVGAVLRTAVQVATGVTPRDDVWTYLLLNWLSTAAGVVVVTPLLLLSCNVHLPHPIRPLRVLEAVAMVAATVAVTSFALVSSGRVLFLAFPLLVWAAWRFQLAGAAPCVAVVAALTIHLVLTGSNPFEEADLTTTLLTVHTFVLSTALATQFLAVAITERNLARQEIEKASNQIVDAVNRLDERMLTPGTPLIDPDECTKKPQAAGRQPVYGMPTPTNLPENVQADNADWAARTLRRTRRGDGSP